MSDLNVNWKDGVGEVTDQPLTVSPGSGAGNASVSFGSVMNNGLDRTLELEITAPKGTKKILTVNQEGCRQAYVTSDGKRWLTSDNRVYGVLKGDAPCQCFDTGMRGVARFRIDDKKQISVIDSCGDSSWIKGRRCLVKKTDAGRELLGLVMERAFTTESLFSQMEDLGHTKGLVSSTEELCKL